MVLDRAFAHLREQAPREARILEAQRVRKTRYRELAEELGVNESHVKVIAQRGLVRLMASTRSFPPPFTRPTHSRRVRLHGPNE